MLTTNLGRGRLVRARAPLRLGFAGGGTDVSPFCDQYGGAVLNATIGMFAYASVLPRTDGVVELHTTDSGDSAIFSAKEALPLDPRFTLHRGVYERVVRDFCDGQRFACTIYTHCDAPPGSGLGSSSTVVVALLAAFQELLGLPLGEYELARLAFSIERQDLAMAGGKQDQYAAAFGGVNFMEFLSDDVVIVNPLRVKRSFLSELEASLVLYFTGVSRASASIIKEQIGNMREADSDAVSAALQLKADAVDIKHAVLTSDVPRFAKVLNRSWEAKKQMAKQITNPQIDAIYELAMANGAYAGKVSGAGGGGFMMFICDPARRPNLVRRLGETEGQVFNAHFVEAGAEAWLPR